MRRHKNICISKKSIVNNKLNNNSSLEHHIQPYDNKESNIISPTTMYLLKYDENDEYIYDLVNSYNERNLWTSENIIIECSQCFNQN